MCRRRICALILTAFYKAIPYVYGFVTKAEEWKYSSAIDYDGGKGLLKKSYHFLLFPFGLFFVLQPIV
jgi:hypothetical protein